MLIKQFSGVRRSEGRYQKEADAWVWGLYEWQSEIRKGWQGI